MEIIILEDSGRGRRMDTDFPVYCIVSGCCRVLDVYGDGVLKRNFAFVFSSFFASVNSTWAFL